MQISISGQCYCRNEVDLKYLIITLVRKQQQSPLRTKFLFYILKVHLWKRIQLTRKLCIDCKELQMLQTKLQKLLLYEVS